MQRPRVRHYVPHSDAPCVLASHHCSHASQRVDFSDRPLMHRRLDSARLGDHLDRLYRAAWALCGSREDAEDLVQETYTRLLARPRLLRNEDDLGYLLRALRNTFLNQKR